MERLNRPLFGCPPTPVTVQSTDGERASWPSQSRAGSSSVYKEFSFTRYIKGDQRLCWGNENGSSGIYIQAATQDPSVSVWALSSNLFTKNWGWLGSPLGCPLGGRSRHPPSGVPLSDKSTLVKAQAASWGSAQLSQSFKVPSRWWLNQTNQELHLLY